MDEQSAVETLGYVADEYVGHPLGDFHVHQHVFEEFWAKLMRQEDIYDYPAELRCKDGSIKQVVIHSNGLWENGKFVHTRCFIRDVTEQKRLEQVLRAAEKQAAMGRVAAGIAHEINNPLETVTNVFYLLRDHPSLDADARELARVANEEMERVRHIARQTLAFCRDSESPVTVSLRLILDDVLEAFRRQIQANRVTVERMTFTDGLVVAFPVELRQIFINLIANALQAMPEGGTLRVSLRHGSQWTAGSARTGIRVSITDTGVGIPTKHRHKIFEPFFTTKAEKGTGLGCGSAAASFRNSTGRSAFAAPNGDRPHAHLFRRFRSDGRHGLCRLIIHWRQHKRERTGFDRGKNGEDTMH